MQAESRRALAEALYATLRTATDPPFARLESWEQDDWIAAAREAERRADPIARGVAIEKAAEAYATFQGWTWPDLSGFAPVTADIELAKLELRQKIRAVARTMVEAYERHLILGGVDGQPHHEDAVIDAIKTQRHQDEQQRLIRKPKPSLPGINGGKVGF